MDLCEIATSFFNIVKQAEVHPPPKMEEKIISKLDDIVFKWSQLKNKVEHREFFGVDVDLSGLPPKYNKIITDVLPYFDVLRVNVIIYTTGNVTNKSDIILGTFNSNDFCVNINIYLPQDSGYAHWISQREDLVKTTVAHELGHMIQYFRWLLQMKESTGKKITHFMNSFWQSGSGIISNTRRKPTDVIKKPTTTLQAEFLKDIEFETYLLDSVRTFESMINSGGWISKTKEQRIKEIMSFVGSPKPTQNTSLFFATLYEYDMHKWRLAVKHFLPRFREKLIDAKTKNI